MKIEEFENAVDELEGITIIIRGPEDDEVGNYDYERATAGKKTITQWKRDRLDGLLEGYEYVILDGDHEVPNGRTLMSTLRDSY